MAARYELRSQLDVDRSSYSTLPGTSTQDFFSKNMTVQKSKISPGNTGCHPGRWIYELAHNSLECNMLDRIRRVDLSKHEDAEPWKHTHRLVINGNQTTKGIISSVCLDCRYHFVFIFSCEEEHSSSSCHTQPVEWPVKDTQFPWHHIVWVDADDYEVIDKDSSSHYPLLTRDHFVCSAGPCTFEVTLEVSEPRMSKSWIRLLQDHDAIREQLRIAREQEPVRYEAATDEWAYQAPINLNTYLKNLLEATTEKEARSISKRNKRFAVLFGPRCFGIFKELGFEEVTRMKSGVDEGAFNPQLPDFPKGPSGTTERGTYRAYLEDVRSEIQCLIHKSGQPTEKPSFCLSFLCGEFQCDHPALEDNPRAEIDRYKLLGILPDVEKEVVVNAYMRQWELLADTEHKDLIDALLAIANDLGNEDLIEYAMTQSSVFESQAQNQSNDDDDGIVAQALDFLGLQPPNKYSADVLIGAYRSKLLSNPADAGTAKSMLGLIAQSAKNDTYQATLMMELDAKMSLPTAKVILGIAGANGFGPDTLENARARIDASSSKEEKAVFIDAMEAIADHTNSNDLKSTVADLRRGFGITSSAITSLSPSERQASNYKLPVGLENIGNTCYLNSLLQYLFTVKPVRDIVLNYACFKLELDETEIKNRLLGGNKMQMDRGEAVVAQAFVQELADLFRNLQNSNKVATRPSQRLANAVLLSTHTLLSTKQTSEPPASTNPPPLPARPPPAVPKQQDEDVDMVGSSEGLPADIETSSNDSTLVDHAAVDEDSDRSYEKVEKSSSATGDDKVQSAMEADDDVFMDDKVTPADAANDVPDAGGDTAMTDAEEQTVDQKVLTALEHQKRSSGTDQQDVEEVMGSILNRLQAAIRPAFVDDSTGIQMEKIMETFFVTTINYTKKFDEVNYQKEISFDRSITAFPAPSGPCSLYEALGRNFDQQIIEESRLSRYTAIKTLPPILHVLIQRSQLMDNKNGNPVTIPETLYLDRFMDAPHDSELFRERIKNWAIADRLADVQAQAAKLDPKVLSGPFLKEYDPFAPYGSKNVDESIVMGDGEVLDKMQWDFDGAMDEDYYLVNQPEERDADAIILDAPPARPEDVDILEASIRDLLQSEIRDRQGKLEEHFSGLKNIPYRLHAVICHRGRLMSGHYWVWIHDFERNVWRKYNDSNVEENPNTEEVLKTLSTSGEPYYLCYVRDEDKDAYVDVPQRTIPVEDSMLEDGELAEMHSSADTKN